MKYAILTLALGSLFATFHHTSPTTNKASNGPILYAISSSGIIYKIDATTCEVCPILSPQGLTGGILDLVVLPDGNILVQALGGLYLYEMPNNNPIWSNNIAYGGSILAPNGLVYLSQAGNTPGLWTFDPATNSITFIGNWPPNIIVSEFFYQNGVLYGVAVEGPPPFMNRLIEVNVTNPDQSTIVVSNPPFNVNGGTTSNGYTTAISTNGSSNTLHQYDISTNTYNTLCTLPAGMNGLSELPPGVEPAPCLCTTFAGTVNTSAFNICVPGSVTVPYNNNATLDANDVLHYILYSVINDTLGSIIVQSSGATFDFNPATMQTGVTYYLATIAGNNLNGNVDLDDPCLDISNTAAQVVWRPLPTVAFSVGNPDVCAGDCRTLQVELTGTPPFSVSGNVLSGNNVVATFSENFNTTTGTLTICVPPGTPLGAVTVQATTLTDTWCVCN